MKKITLKISFFLLLTVLAFQGYAQVTSIVEGTKYTLQNVGTGKYLQADGNGAYIFADAVASGDNTFNFTFYHHDTVDPDTGTVHSYMSDWNIQGDVRGIMRAGASAANGGATGTTHTNFKYNVWNSNGGWKTDKRFTATTQEVGTFTFFRFSPLADNTDNEGNTNTNPDRYLYHFEDDSLDNIEEGDMTDSQRSLWLLAEVPALSNTEFDASSIFVSNPVKNMLSIKGLTNNVKQVSVFSLIGNEVKTQEVNGAESLNIDISTLASGMYILDFKGVNGSFTKKIVKQ